MHILQRQSPVGKLKTLDLVEVGGKQYWLVDKFKKEGKWYKRLLPVIAGGGLGFQDAPMVLIQDGPALNTYTAAKSVFGLAGTDLAAAVRYTTPSNFWQIGKALKVTALGDLSNIITTPGTHTWEFRVGPTSNIVGWTSGAVQMSSTAHTSLPFWLEIMMTCQTIGAGAQAKMMGQGRITSIVTVNTAVADAVANTLPTLLLPNTTPAQGTGFDSSAPSVLDLFLGFSISNAGNGVRIRQFALEALD
jgi:hypothetical protein